MLKVKRHGVILEPTSLGFEAKAVLNPAIWQDGETVHIYYRAIDNDDRSCIGYARLQGPKTVVERWDKPFMLRTQEYESYGVEDPRIVKLGGTYYMFYVAHDGKNAITAYATSPDLKKFRKHGIISAPLTYREAEGLFGESQLKDSYYLFSAYYQRQAGHDVLVWHKDVFLFPRKINGQYALMHRILPDIQIAFFKNFKDVNADFWRDHIRNLSHFVVLENKHWFESRNIGGSCPPIELPEGWLVIFHTVEEVNKGRVYHACVALLDKDDPLKVKARLHQPLFSPTESYERSGFVSNVVFPSGTARFNDELYIYYGAADKRIAVVSANIHDLLAEMKKPPAGHDHEI
jgi:predicted GH43/DUF377 family glycosyl hydrolase